METKGYLYDPALECTLRVAKDEAGLWYIFRNDGREYVYDSLDDLSRDYAKMYIANMTGKKG